MALQLPFTDARTGASYSQSYQRIVGFAFAIEPSPLQPAGTLNPDDTAATISVAIYVSGANRQAGKGALDQVDYALTRTQVADVFSLAAASTDRVAPALVSAYLWLKSLPAFQGATDV